MDLEKNLKALSDYLDSPAGKAHIEEYRKKLQLEDSRILKVKAYVEKVGMYPIMERLINEHDETWREHCYLKNYEPYENNKLELMFRFVRKYGKESSKSFGNKHFSYQTWEYGDFYFNLMHGQGSVLSIYLKNKCIY